MELNLAIRVFEVLLGLSLLLQTLEYMRLPSLDKVALWPLMQHEIPDRPAWIKSGLNQVFRPLPYQCFLTLRLVLALALMAGQVGLMGSLVLFLMALMLLLRWRGAFNGGSDFMTLVCLTGLLISHVLGAATTPSFGWQGGFWYITLQTVSSYFVSGWVKLLRPEWRKGQAMTLFLNTGVYGPLPKVSWYRSPRVAWASTWTFTLLEGCFPLALLDVRLAMAFCVSAGVFHFLVFWFFGLNRFFWAWLSTYPALLFCAGAW